MTGTCDVCQKEDVEVYVCASSCGPISFGYCKECLKAGVEPYWALVAYASGAWNPDNTYADWFEEVIEYTLKHHDITREQFNFDVEEENKAFLEQCARQGGEKEDG